MNWRDRLADIWLGSMLLRVIVVAVVACALFTLVGCTEVHPKPIVLTVEKKVYVAIPDALTKPCPIEEPQNHTVPEAVRVARARKASLHGCNADKAQIKGIQGTPVPDGEKQR